MAAEDATQEVFLRAYTKLRAFDQGRRFSTWLFAIASNYSLDQCKSPRHRLLYLDDIGFKPGAIPTTHNLPEMIFIEAEVATEVRDLVCNLTPDYRQPVFMRYWYDMPLQEIADHLDLTVNTVKGRLFRARKMLGQGL
jgi:RNA polymerase sigma-70 factor (ECF subfamily)